MRAEFDRGTHAEDHTALGHLVLPWPERVRYVEVHGCDALVLFQLSANLICHELHPGVLRQVEVLDERARKDFRRYQVFV